MVENTMTLQWHISEKCNLKCYHCYQENKEYIELEYEKLINILEQYKEFLRFKNLKGHINLTGGEPLCNKNFFKLLKYMHNDKELYTYAILTNGTLITDEIALKISQYEPLYVQVSIDGGKKVHEEIRGKGTLNKTINAIKILKRYGIYTSISFTAQKNNFKEFKNVVKIGKEAGANRVWTDRFIPIGGAEELKSLVLNKEETKEFFDILSIEKEKSELEIERFIKRHKVTRNEALRKCTEVSSQRALQFLECNSDIYSCSAGTTLITIMENGDLVPCRRMPIVIGNILKNGNTIKDLYENSEIIRKLQKQEIPSTCKECEYNFLCRGRT